MLFLKNILIDLVDLIDLIDVDVINDIDFDMKIV